MFILGINAVFHDSSACILQNGQLLAAAEEERFTHIKHSKRPVPFSTYELPFHAINYCLKIAGITLKEVDHIAYSFDPALLPGSPSEDETQTSIPCVLRDDVEAQKHQSWDNLFAAYIRRAPAFLCSDYPHHLQNRFKGASPCNWQWHFVDHHMAHAASGFLPSPFSRAAIITLDGRGETASTTYNVVEDNRIIRIGQVNLPHSLGLLYEEITARLGFLRSSDEFKVMALASYGEPNFADDFRDIVQVSGKGQYQIHSALISGRLGPVRLPNTPFDQRHFDIARSLQLVLEESVLTLLEWLHQQTGEKHLCFAGGVALNCALNAKIRDHSPFEKIWVQPAAGDSGTALGAAWWVDQQMQRIFQRPEEMEHAYLGPEYPDVQIETALKKAGVPYSKMDDIARETSDLLAENKVIGWFQGRMEFGPRALGARSILASPIRPEMQARLNFIKDREDFRPVAPVVLEEDAGIWFRQRDASPFMLFLQEILPEKAAQIPAVRHVDGTARIQTVGPDHHPLYYQLLKAFKEKTGVPVLVNTSFNTLGKPIVCTPRDALECFWSSPIDALVMGAYLIRKDHEYKNHHRNSDVQQTQTYHSVS